jgi:hypothetical protein
MKLSYKNGKDIFTTKWKFAIMKGLIFTVIIFSAYLFFMIKVNGIHWFGWSIFPWSLNNVYFLLLPEILTIICIIAVFFNEKSKMNQLIK